MLRRGQFGAGTRLLAKLYIGLCRCMGSWSNVDNEKRSNVIRIYHVVSNLPKLIFTFLFPVFK